MMNTMMNITNEYLGMVINHGEAHKNFWTKFHEAKSEKLFDLFGDKLIVEKEVKIQKQLRDIADDIITKNLGAKILKAVDPAFREAFEDHSLWGWKRDEYNQDQIERLERKEIINYITNRDYLAKQVFDREKSFKHPTTGKTIKAQTGSKISKFFKNVISDPAKLEEVQTLYSQILNDKFIQGSLCLSIHPLDYLTASVNDSGWESCYNTMDKGAYCASTLCLINSPNTFIAYLKSSKDMECGWGSNKLTWNNKKWRTWVTLADNNEIVHVGRNYPYESHDLMNEAINMVMDLTKKEYGAIETNEDFISINAPYNMYNDADNGSLYVAMTETFKHGVSIYPVETVNVSPAGSICPICGNHFDDIECDIVCSDCGEFERCYHCDCVAHEGERTWVEGISSYVCDDCCSEYYDYCEECGEYEERENTVAVKVSYHERYGYATRYVCQWCFDNNSKYTTCESCGDPVMRADTRDDGTCYNCEPIEVEDEDADE